MGLLIKIRQFDIAVIFDDTIAIVSVVYSGLNFITIYQIGRKKMKAIIVSSSVVGVSFLFFPVGNF